MSHPLIHDLLQIEAVKIEKEDLFTWTSGIRSPIYCDNRLTMSYPEIRTFIADSFVERIQSSGEIDIIAGCATAGIPHAAWVSERMDLPMVYVRSSPKKHGKGNQIEGKVHAGQRAIVIEDLISTGKSSIEAAEALRAAGVEVVAVLSIFSYNLAKADAAFNKHQLAYDSLASYDELLQTLMEQGQLDEDERKMMAEWKQDPEIFTKT